MRGAWWPGVQVVLWRQDDGVVDCRSCVFGWILRRRCVRIVVLME